MKELTIQLKRLGKKKIKLVPIELDSEPQNVKQLIESCVRSEVRKYNEKREDQIVLSFLSPAQIEKQSRDGKIGFGDLANKTLAKEDAAIENALLAFKDGLYLVFIDDTEITDIETAIKLSPESVVSFIRMTFLAGTHW